MTGSRQRMSSLPLPSVAQRFDRVDCDPTVIAAIRRATREQQNAGMPFLRSR